MDSDNNIDNCALYIFLFLSMLSFGNDFYHVYLQSIESDFIKGKFDKMSDYYKLFENVLCNNTKKIKNKLVLDIKENGNKINKEEKNKEKEIIKIDKNNDKKEKKQKKKKKDLVENNIIEKKTDDDYEKNINIMKNIVKKKTKQKKDENDIN